MKKMFTKLGILTALIIFIGCKSEPEKPSGDSRKQVINSKPDNINLSFLLDLSDRIDPQKYPNPSMEYYLRDVGYINLAASAFEQHLRKKRMMQADDKIQLFFDPEPSNPEINAIANSLKFNINRNNISQEQLDKINSSYKAQPLKIYELAIKDGKQLGRYDGSKTWGFFKNKLKDNCIEPNHRNILIVLTDGYIYHKDNRINEKNKTTYLTPEYIRDKKLNTADWQDKMQKEGYGFIPAATDLSNIEILVLGINPSAKNPYEQDVIEKYWKDWLTEMKVKHFEIKTANLPSEMEGIIQKFISVP